MTAKNRQYKQPRESRLIAGVLVLIFGIGIFFFSCLVALESFSQSPIVITLFLGLGLIMIVAGLCFSACIPELEIDQKRKVLIIATSCILFKKKKFVPFSKLKEVGIKELYHAGDRSDETGSSYYVEIRSHSNIEVPGTKGRSIDDASRTAGDIADQLGVSFNPKIRDVFTGSIKIS
ncbi:tetraspanin family protein [Pleionea sediminis]|uniref:tetraspanin family protein n=1 Tax=Pleionea sediminis TaxID=2569479 RepID=UPI001184C446|nr:tetraspanin family protein [Pleionea sediminis]